MAGIGETSVAATFERDYGCTESEWQRWLPDAVHGHPLERLAADRACVAIGAGRLDLSWQVAAPRVIALVSLPRLLVRFSFTGVPDTDRALFLRGFDLRTQRGGG